MLIIIALFIISCGQEKKEPTTEKGEVSYDEQKQLDSLNLIETGKISKSSNAIMGWDTAEHFTYSIQELFETGARPISFIGVIKDIIKKDSTYILNVVGSNSQSNKTFIAEISVNTTMFQELKSKLHRAEDNEGCFIFIPTRIKSSSKLAISSYVSHDFDAETVEEANDNASSELTYDFGDVLLFFKGKMINFYLYKHLE